MRHALIVMLLPLAGLAATAAPPAFAQRPPSICDKTDSTAAVLDCLNRETQRVQDRLSATFKTVIEEQSEETRTLLNDSQKDWLIYRDSQCRWETGLSETPALTRVYELACLRDLTEDRAALLSAVSSRQKEKTPREFGSQPRWMTILAETHPDIFWRYGDWKSADLDCDGEDEEIMTGIAVARIQDSVVVGNQDAKEQAHHQIEIVIAVSENPVTGKPRAQLVRLPVTETPQGGAPHICRPSVRLEVLDTNGDMMEKTEGEAGKPACARRLKIEDSACAPVEIMWDGKEYRAAIETKPETETKSAP